MVILTADVGQGYTRFALIDPKTFKPIREVTEKPSDYSTIQDQIIQGAKATPNLEAIALSVTHPIKRASTIAVDLGGGEVLSLDKITTETGKPSHIYNIAVATALAINIDGLDRIVLKKADNPFQERDKSVIYLGDGMHLVKAPFNRQTKSNEARYGMFPETGAPLDMFPREYRKEFGKRAYSWLKTMPEEHKWERLRPSDGLSTRGLVNLYEIMHGNIEVDPELKGWDAIRSKLTHILQDDSLAAQTTLQEYCSILGRFAHFAAGYNSEGGIYVTGPLANRIADHLDPDTITEEFNDARRIPGFHAAMDSIPITFLREPYAANMGAAYGAKNNIPTSVNIF